MFFAPLRSFKKDAAGRDFLIVSKELRNWEKWGVRLRFGRGIDGRECTWSLASLIDGNEL